jgi:hemerythrin-like domain-containing protein
MQIADRTARNLDRRRYLMPTRSTPRGGAAARNKIIAMLKADHKKVKQAFKDFEKLDAEDDPDSCQALVQQTCAELEVHAELEEQVFYPAARSAMKEDDLIDEAEVEHMTAKVLIGQLKGMNAEDEKYAATFKVLGEYINHHVKEEEGEIFKKMTQPDVDWSSVLDRMQQQRMQLLEEKGLPAEPEAETRMSARTPAGGAMRSGVRGESQARPQAASNDDGPSSRQKK